MLTDDGELRCAYAIRSISTTYVKHFSVPYANTWDSGNPVEQGTFMRWLHQHDRCYRRNQFQVCIAATSTQEQYTCTE